MARIILALALCVWSVGAWAQGCGPQNPNCVVPDRPPGDSTNSAANTRFVQLSGGGGGGGGSTFGAAFPTTGTAIGGKNAGLMQPFNLDGSGNLLVNVASGGGTGGTSSTFGAAFPGTGTAMGLKFGANMVNANADSSGNLLVNVAAGGGAGPVAPGSNLIGSVGYNVGGTLTTPIGCGSTAVYSASTSGSTQLVALSGSTVIYVCGYTITTGTGGSNVQLTYGTGAACASGTTAMTPAYNLGANSGIVDHTVTWTGLRTASATALCINSSAANPVQALVYYTQF